MKERLEQLLKHEDLTQAQFADRISVARAGISHIMSGRNKPSYEFIVNTIEAFPDLNIEWLLTGKGEMLKQTEALSSNVRTLFRGGARKAEKVLIFYDDGSFQEIF